MSQPLAFGTEEHVTVNHSTLSNDLCKHGLWTVELCKHLSQTLKHDALILKQEAPHTVFVILLRTRCSYLDPHQVIIRGNSTEHLYMTSFD